MSFRMWVEINSLDAEHCGACSFEYGCGYCKAPFPGKLATRLVADNDGRYLRCTECIEEEKKGRSSHGI